MRLRKEKCNHLWMKQFNIGDEEYYYCMKCLTKMVTGADCKTISIKEKGIDKYSFVYSGQDVVKLINEFKLAEFRDEKGILCWSIDIENLKSKMGLGK